MKDEIDIVFLGLNDAGMRVYEWLCDYQGVFVHSLITQADQLSLVEEVAPDYIISCGYRYIIPEETLDIPSEGAINLHPSYLPYNRGAHPNVWSIIDGTPAGVTLHYMDPEVDSGDIIAQQEVKYSFEDTGKDLYERLEEAQVKLFKQVWPEIMRGDVTSTEQDVDSGTYHRSSEFDELCVLNPDEKVQTKNLLNRLRALTFPPYDNAKIEVNGETYNVEIDIDRD